jgi:PAS domain S-box-containing protein
MQDSLKILYLDNKEESKIILNYLLELGYDVRLVNSIYDAKTQMLSTNYDLFIAETDIKDGNSLDFIEDMKKNSIKSVIVSKNKDPDQLLRAIEINVEKYLLKPINLQMLHSTIKECLSTIQKAKNPYLTKELIELENKFNYSDKLKQIIADNGNSIPLTQQESNLIQTLIQQKGSYCSHATLQTAISISGKIATIDTLRTVIKRIRQKTYEGIIDSLNGVGYKINLKTQKNKQNISSLITVKEINKKILIVKGNETRNRTLQKKLSQYGLICEEVFLLQEAKEALKHEVFDYIIVDLKLPDGDGAELLRNKQNTESNKIIVLSNFEDMHYKEYLFFKGVIDYIEKREDLDYLAFSIYQTISKIESNHVNNNILLVENSKKIAGQINDILLPRNYKVDIVNSSEKIIELIKHKPYNLIILDLELDGINSLDFLISLKKQVDKALPIIMLSGEQRSYSQVRECYINGAVECLRKPIFAEEFILKIDQWTEYYKQTLEIKDTQRLLHSYKTIVDNTVIVSKTDTQGIITYANDIFCDISGYSREELIGQPHNIIRHPDMQNSLFEEMWNTISKEKKIWHGVLKNKKKDGTHYIVSTYIMPILDYNNDVLEYIALRNDLTNIKKS